MNRNYSESYFIKFNLTKYCQTHGLPNNRAIAIKFNDVAPSEYGISWKVWNGPYTQKMSNKTNKIKFGGVEIRGFSDTAKSDGYLFKIVAILEDGFQYTLEQFECSLECIQTMAFRINQVRDIVAIKFKKLSTEKCHCRFRFESELEAETFHNFFKKKLKEPNVEPLEANDDTFEFAETNAPLPVNQAFMYYLGRPPSNDNFENSLVANDELRRVWTSKIHNILMDPEFETFLYQVDHMWRSQCL